MDEQTLLDERLLSSTAFVRDFEALLNLSADALLAIPKSGDGQDGFIGHGNPRNLNARFDIPIDKAARVLRIVGHLYNRVSELSLDVTVAVDQISSIASELESPIDLDDQKRMLSKRFCPSIAPTKYQWLPARRLITFPIMAASPVNGALSLFVSVTEKLSKSPL